MQIMSHQRIFHFKPSVERDTLLPTAFNHVRAVIGQPGSANSLRRPIHPDTYQYLRRFGELCASLF